MIEYLIVLIALALGYIIGLLQNGININYQDPDPPEEYNKSIGVQDFMEYYDETDGANKF